MVRFRCAALLALTIGVLPSFSTNAMTAVVGKDYALRIRHAELSRVPLEQGRHGLELQLTLINRGSHDLYDVRLFVIRAASRTLVGVQEPARVRKLAAGEQTKLTWTFELAKPLVGPLNDVVFRVEAVDRATKQIVTFNQKSAEVR